MRVTVLLIVLLASLARAQTPLPSPGNRFEDRFRLADRDGDGALSAAEARQSGWLVDRVDEFERIDRDGSGTVTLVEIGNAITAKVKQWMNADSDRDGRVSEKEAREQSLTETFEKADVDGDRFVSREELEGIGQRSYYRDAELPSVAPNIIEKRF